MSRARAGSFHDHFCATRSVVAAAIFVGSCALVLVAGWRELGRFPTVGAFTQVYLILGIGICLAVFKCVRERVVFGLWLLTPARVLLFAADPGLANWSGFAYRVDLVASAFALVVSISMLISALRRRNRPSLCEPS